MKIETVEGIGPRYAKKFRELGIYTTEGLLKHGATKVGRKKIAKQFGLTERIILEWVNRADLMRIKGVGEEYSDLLDAAGADTIKELRHRNANNLYKKMQELNEAKHLVRKLPSLGTVNSWIEQAKLLPPIVRYDVGFPSHDSYTESSLPVTIVRKASLNGDPVEDEPDPDEPDEA